MILLEGILPELKSAMPTPAAISGSALKLAEEGSGSGTLDSFIQMLGLLVLLIIILIITYFTTKFIGGVRLGQLKDSNFKVIDSYRISSNKVIQIVKIGNKYIVIGIGKDTINYITELEETEVVNRELHTTQKQSFKQTFEKIRNNIK